MGLLGNFVGTTRGPTFRPVTGPSHADRSPSRRGHQTVRTAPPSRLGERIPPTRPTPGQGAPRGDRLTGATLAHTPGRPLLPAAPRSPTLASSRLARRVPPRPPVTAPSLGGARGAGRGGRTWRAQRWPAARRGVSRRGPAGGGGPAGARDPPGEHLRVRGPGPPRWARKDGPNFQPSSHARPPPSTIWKSTSSESDTSKIPRPLHPPSPSRAAFLSAEIPGGGADSSDKICWEGWGELGGRESREALPRFFFFFHQEESTRFFPSSEPWQAEGTCGELEPSQTRPQSGGRSPPGARVAGAPRRARGAPALWRQVFPGKPGAPGTLRDRNALWRTRRPAGVFQRPGTRQPRHGARVPSSLLHALPSLGLKNGAPGAPHTGSPTPSQPATQRIPAVLFAAPAAAAAAALLLLRQPPPLK